MPAPDLHGPAAAHHPRGRERQFDGRRRPAFCRQPLGRDQADAAGCARPAAPPARSISEPVRYGSASSPKATLSGLPAAQREPVHQRIRPQCPLAARGPGRAGPRLPRPSARGRGAARRGSDPGWDAAGGGHARCCVQHVRRSSPPAAWADGGGSARRLAMPRLLRVSHSGRNPPLQRMHPVLADPCRFRSGCRRTRRAGRRR